MERFWSKVSIGDADACWEWQAGRHTFGYGAFEYKIKGKWRAAHAHRVAWELVNGDIPDGMFVCHRCDNPPCVNPGHLFLGTPRQNTLDMLQKDRASMPSGVAHPRYTARLTEEQVREIRRRWPSETQQSLASEFGVGVMTVNHIVNRRTWKHI